MNFSINLEKAKLQIKMSEKQPDKKGGKIEINPNKS